MDIKKWISALGFIPKEGTINVYTKQYPLHNYHIDINLNNSEIDYNEIKADSKTTQNFAQPENFVVLDCVDRLLTKGYKPQNIVLEKTWSSGHGTSGRLDIYVTHDNSDSPYILIECKTYGKEFDKEIARTYKDGGQLFTYFQLSGHKADVIMLYASELKGKEIVYKNEIVKIEDEYRSGEVKDIYEKWNKLTKDNGIFNEWVRPYNFQSKALTNEENQLKKIDSEAASKIFNEFLEILRHNVVSDKGNAFNKIFTLFLCKVYDETMTPKGEKFKFQWLEGVDDHTTFQLRLTELYSKGMQQFLDRTVSDFDENDFNERCKNLSDETKNYLLQEVNKLRLEKNNEFAIKEVYDSKSFEENAKVVKEVVELIQGYQIRYNKRQQYLSDFFELLLTTGLKQEAGQFFTPVPIAQFIIKSLPLDTIVAEKLKEKDAEILPYMIDYAAGSGHFITEYMHEVQEIINAIDPKKYIDATAKKIRSWQDDHFDWATKYVYGVEKDYRLVKVGKVGCYLHGDGLANVILSDGLASFSKNKEYKLKLKKEDNGKDNQQFDILLSNPPYSISSFRQTTRDYYAENDFELYKHLTDNSSEIECLFVERTKQLLKEGGVAGVILPSSILSNTGIYTKTRELILQYFDIVAIAEFGNNTFMATGTNTVVLFLRRCSNYHAKNIKDAVESYITTLNDVTINGIEKPVEKYVAHVWEGLSYADYVTLMQKSPNDQVKAHEIYTDYCNKVKSKDDKEFWQKVISLECEKITYFIISYHQEVVLIKSGAEKRFLGYEFSDRRGNMGIHPIQRGKNIDECTQLFDINSYDNPEKASTYIYRAFNGDFESEIAESMQQNVSRVNLVDMFTFDRADFEKTISTAVKKKVNSIHPLKPINSLVDIIRGVTYSKQAQTREETNNIVLTADNITLNGDFELKKKIFLKAEFIPNQEKYLCKNDCFMCFSSGSKQHVGKVAFIKEDTNFLAGGFMGILRPKKHSQILPKYLYEVLNSNIIRSLIATSSRGSNINNLSNSIGEIKIPLPPLNIQQKIVDEIEILEQEEIKLKDDIKSLAIKISSVMDTFTGTNTKLEDIALLLKRGKSAKYGKSNIQLIKSGQARGGKKFDFSNRYFTDDNFVLDERKLEKGDILINSTGVGTAGRVTMFDLDGVFVVDSHITILRPNTNKALPCYILQSLVKIGFKNIEAMAKGQSGQIELSLSTIQNIKIPLPPISDQQKLVSKIEALEAEIAQVQSVIDKIPAHKADILKKHL